MTHARINNNTECTGTKNLLGSFVKFPVYGLIIIGVVFLILIGVITYLLIKKYIKKRRVYSTLEENNNFSSNNCLVENSEASLIGHLNHRHEQCVYNVPRKQVKAKSGIFRLEKQTVNQSEPIQKNDRSIEMITRNNQMQTILTPEQMKKLCDEVLKNIDRKKSNDKESNDIEKAVSDDNSVVKTKDTHDQFTSYIDLKESMRFEENETNEIGQSNESSEKVENINIKLKHKEFIKEMKEVFGKPSRQKDDSVLIIPKNMNSIRKSISVSNLNIYDVVPNGSPIKVKIHTTVDDIELIRPRKSIKTFYEEFYKIPITLKEVYVNAN